MTSVIGTNIGPDKRRAADSPQNFRKTNVCKSNPRFWETRPLTSKMTAWAASDVDKLIQVTDKQNKAINVAGKDRAMRESKKASTLTKHMALERRLSIQNGFPIGLFVGRKGHKIQELQERTGTIIKTYYTYESSFFLVFYPTPSALAAVKRAMGYN